MLAVVVDDHDMGVTHIIRGDDHLNNAARQNLIYSASQRVRASVKRFSSKSYAHYRELCTDA
jgi:glutamyl/glutaminyl-tRNA synthetase